MYKYPAVPVPTTEQLKSVSHKLCMNISDDDLKDYKDYMVGFLAMFNQLEELDEPGLPAKYSGGPGYKPTSEKNKFNAWARITNTMGSSTGKLAGKTVAIKDNVALAGVPMSNGSHFFDGYVSPYNATIVSRILDAGAVIKGKATCENLCFTGSSFSSVPLPVLNPYDPARSSGGSSSGCGVLVACGEVDMAVGTDQGGSIRLPSCWCGIVGLKPTYGLVPYTGIIPLEGSMDFVGPMAKTVHECALLLEVMAGYDNGLDPRQHSNLPVPKYTDLLTGDLKGYKIALIQEGFEGCEPDVASLVRSGAMKLTSVGATVDEISFPVHNHAGMLASVIISRGSYDTYVNGGITPLNCKGFKDTTTHDFLFNAAKAKADCIPPSLKSVFLTESYIKENYGCRFYAKATNIMRSVITEYDKLFEKYDALIMPTIKHKPPILPDMGFSLKDFLGGHLEMTANTIPYNGTGHPAITINAGFSEGLPVGMMVISKMYEDGTVLKVASAFEKIRDDENEKK